MSVEFLSGTNRENRIRELENFIEVFKRTNYSYQPPSYKYVSKSPTAYFEVGGKRIQLIDYKIVESVYRSLESELRSLKDNIRYDEEETRIKRRPF